MAPLWHPLQHLRECMSLRREGKQLAGALVDEVKPWAQMTWKDAGKGETSCRPLFELCTNLSFNEFLPRSQIMWVKSASFGEILRESMLILTRTGFLQVSPWHGTRIFQLYDVKKWLLQNISAKSMHPKLRRLSLLPCVQKALAGLRSPRAPPNTRGVASTQNTQKTVHAVILDMCLVFTKQVVYVITHCSTLLYAL